MLKTRTACSCRMPADRSAAMNRITPMVTTVTRPITRRMYSMTDPRSAAAGRDREARGLDVLVRILPVIGVGLRIAQHHIARPRLRLPPGPPLRPLHRQADPDEADAPDLAGGGQVGDAQTGTGEVVERQVRHRHPGVGEGDGRREGPGGAGLLVLHDNLVA